MPVTPQSWLRSPWQSGRGPVVAGPPPGGDDGGVTATHAESALRQALEAKLGPRAVLADRDSLASFEADWTRRFRGRALLAVRPADTAGVAAAMRICARHGAPIVVQGGNTSLVAGAIPADGEVLLLTHRLASLEDVDVDAATVVAGAGLTLEALQQHVAPLGFAFGVDLASRGSATIGGMTATNAGGIHVVRYGNMRAQVAGVEAVLADGTVLDRLHGPAKDNTGYDLPGLLCGSEGTLAVITRVRLRLLTRQPQHVTALLALDSTAGALAVVSRLRPLAALEAVEVFYREGLDLVCAHRQLPPPLAGAYHTFLLVECAAHIDPLPELAAALEVCPAVRDSAVATDAVGRARLWSYREGHTEAINAAGVPAKLDVAVPLGRAAAFEAELRALVAAEPGARLVLFGHLAEGNFHVNLLDVADESMLEEAVLRLVLRHGGSISSEHGIGRAKSRWLELARAPEDVALMRRVKRAFDPEGRLSPGVVFPL